MILISNEIQKQMYQLLIRFFLDEVSEQEQLLIEFWLSSSDKNMERFADLHEQLDTQGLIEYVDSENYDWDELKGTI